MSIVSYFALPPEFAPLIGVPSPEGCADKSTIGDTPPLTLPDDPDEQEQFVKALNLLKQFVNVPSEEERADMWARYGRSLGPSHTTCIQCVARLFTYFCATLHTPHRCDL